MLFKRLDALKRPTHNFGTRHKESGRLVVPNTRKQLSRKLPEAIFIKLFNSMPDHLRNALQDRSTTRKLAVKKLNNYLAGCTEEDIRNVIN